MIMAARADDARRIMIAAQRLQMTGEEYVYLQAIPYIQPPGYLDLLWRMDDEGDETARAAFPALLSITFDNEHSIDTLPNATLEYILDLSKRRFNRTYENGERISAATVAAFEAILTTTAVLQDVLDEQENGTRSDVQRVLKNVSKFAKRYWNRTFTLPTGELYFDENGDHSPDILLRQFNVKTGKYENSMRYGAASRRLLNESHGLRWRGGRAPLNEPACGYDGTKAICNKTTVTLAVSVTVICFLLALSGMITLLLMRHFAFVAKHGGLWWQLNTPDVGLRRTRSRHEALERRDTVNTYNTYNTYEERSLPGIRFDKPNGLVSRLRII